MILEHFFAALILFFMFVVLVAAMVKVAVGVLAASVRSAQKDEPEDFDPENPEYWL